MKNYYVLNLGEVLLFVIFFFVSSKQIYNICVKKYEENRNLDDDLKKLYESILKKLVSINLKIVKQNKEKIMKFFLKGFLEFDLKNFDMNENIEKNLLLVEFNYNLIEEQYKVLNSIIFVFDEGGYRNIFLFGVIGSGKIEVYIRVI